MAEIDQSDWLGIVARSAYTVTTICLIYGINRTSFLSYLNGTKPKEKNMKKMDIIMKDLVNKPSVQKHPSRGYATEEEWSRLSQIGVGPERDRIMAQIKKRTDKRGKE